MDVIKEFQKFLLRGNIVDLAIGFTVGAAFSTVARSLVDDIIMPPIASLLGSVRFENMRWILKSSPEGDITINYGRFINNLLALVLVGIAMFVLIKLINSLDDKLVVLGRRKKKEAASDPANKKCPYCYSTIDFKATRCPNCTSKLEIPEINNA